jgi:hypothetical protein
MNEPDIVEMRLRVVTEVECQGEVMQKVWLGVLAEISKRSPGGERNCLIRDFAYHIADAAFCDHCWRPIDKALREIIVIGQRIQ